MEIEAQLMSLEDNTMNANNVKSIVVKQLLEDGKIYLETAKEYTEKWQMIVIKRGWFERWVEAFKISEPKQWQFKFVRFEK